MYAYYTNKATKSYNNTKTIYPFEFIELKMALL